ncbi:hypothetical protein P7H62_04500 [Vagococcus carniphilus]|uniref:hypothetical protein n=1 Tax=Vagococcus carniphilus TaxID=218144 RepID=UPI00288D9490|nr:hypothetical protein [Vagococcus carniphilus]MDT2830965.1 hypothetical protein [Vagococcus carniphilus]MDT2838138.1 hypothetical protein [Vagococcus carniphilus]MDT2853701.1 hypothetical protein [Vagococcus carniphilus]
MNLVESKEEEMNVLLHGEEILIDEMLEKCQSCSIYVANAKITKETVNVIDLTKTDSIYSSLLINRTGPPLYSKKTTTELIKIYRSEDNNTYDIIKGVLKAIYDKLLYCVPDIDPEALFIPLDGPSSKHPDYINFSMLNGMESYSDGQTLLSFSNYLDLVIPKRYQSNYQKFSFAFECHSVFCYFNGNLNRYSDGFDYLKKWHGTFHKEMEAVTAKVVSKLTLNEFKEIKDRVVAEKYFRSNNGFPELLDW